MFQEFQKNRDPSFGAKNYLKFKAPSGVKKPSDEPMQKRNDNQYQPDQDEFEDI